MSVVSFAKATAEKMGVNERTIFRLLSVGRVLDKKSVGLLRASPKKVTLADLQTLSKCAPDDRPVICRELSLGKAKSAKEVLDRRRQPGAARPSAAEKELQKLDDAFARASKATRKRFVQAHRDILRELMAGDEDENASEVVTFKARERS